MKRKSAGSHRSSLKRKLLLPLLLGFLFFLTAGTAATIRLINNQVELRLKERGQSIANSISIAAENLEEKVDLQRIVSATASEPGVELVIMVAGIEPHVVACSERRWVGKSLNELPDERIGEDLKGALASRNPGMGRWHLETDEYDWTVFCRPTLPEVADIKPTDGAIMVHLATSEIRARVRQSTLILAGTASAGFALLLFLTYRLIMRHVLSPLAQISGRLSLVTGETGAIDPGHSRDDEVGQLVEALNHAAQERRQRDAALLEARQTIDDANKERAARETEQRLVAQAPTALAMFDPEMRYLACSTRWTETFHLPPGEEIPGRSHYEFFPDPSNRWKAVHRRVMAGETLRAEEESVERADGSEIWANWECRPWRTSAGEIGGIIFWADDVTDQVLQREENLSALRQSEANFRNLWESSRDAQVLIFPPDWNLTSGNPAAVALYGAKDASHLAAYTPAGLSPERQPDGEESGVKAKRLIEKALSEGSAFFEWLHHRVDGTGFLCEVSLTRTALDKIIGLQASIRDITERKRLEQELLKERDHLDETVRRRTIDLERAKEAAESATRAKSNFLANMSHEVRSPMTVILGYADVLLDPKTPPADREAAVEAIQRNGQHLLEVINDVLDISRIEVGKLGVELADLDPWDLLQSVITTYQVQATEKEIQLKLRIPGPIPRTIQADATRLRQILINLLSNALKFTESGRQIDVEVTVQQVPRAFCISVMDQGIGMTPEQISRLFKPFEQADNSMTRKYGGTGLGLSISKLLAEAMGASIEVRSVLGQGSTFRLLFPLADNAALEEVAATASVKPLAPAGQAISPTDPTSGNRILLVDDTLDLQKLMAFRLRKAGYEVTTAANGRIAMDLALQHPFDVILMDIQMPVMDGQEATRELRKAGYTGPVIGLSAHAMKGEREKNLECGMDEYLTKPVETEVLVATLDRFIQGDRTDQNPAG